MFQRLVFIMIIYIHHLPYEYGTGADALHKGDGDTEAHSNEYNYQKYEICLKDISKYCQKNKC